MGTFSTWWMTRISSGREALLIGPRQFDDPDVQTSEKSSSNMHCRRLGIRCYFGQGICGYPWSILQHGRGWYGRKKVVLKPTSELVKLVRQSQENMVARDGIEPPTPAFSGLRSTD